MAKIKLTKNELKKQRDALKRFRRYLPTLQLKKQQLQLEIIKIHKRMEDNEEEIKAFEDNISLWVDVFAEKIDIKDLVTVSKVHIGTGNVAGVDIPILSGIDFRELKYDLMTFPLWVDYALEAVKEMVSLKINYQTLEKQEEAIREELRITNQRVNLFEKVKIPEAQENIRKIQIYLGDMETAAVVIGKIAKEKIQVKRRALVNV